MIEEDMIVEEDMIEDLMEVMVEDILLDMIWWML